MAFRTIQLPGVAGPSNVVGSVNADCENSIDCYAESTKPGLGKVQYWLRKRPGLELRYSIGANSVKKLFEQDGRAFGVAETQFVELFSNDTFIARGTVVYNGDPATICSNGSAGNQLFVTSGGYGYIFDLNTNILTLIADGEFPQGVAKMGEFMDGYFFVLIANSRRWQISGLEDGTDWDALDVAERSIASDNILIMIRSGRTMVFLGTKTSEVWYDTGDAGFPFAPIQGVFLEVGAAAAFSAVRADNTASGDSLFWLGQSARGAGVVYRLNGYTPERLSTFAIEKQIQDLTDSSDAIGFSIQIQGHTFYILSLAEARTTPVYDVTEGLWCQFSEWNTTTARRDPWLVQCGCYAFGKHLVGDRRTGAIYECDYRFLSDGAVVV